MAGSMVYRLPVGDLSAPHMVTFAMAMTAAEALSDNRGYNYIAGFHGAPNWYCWHHQQSRHTPLQARLFLPWHRAYLWWLEQALQDQVPGAALPYWDWTAIADVPLAYAGAKMSGSANPLRATRALVPTATPPIRHRTVRRPGSTPGSRLPLSSEIADLLNDGDWASFSDRLEFYGINHFRPSFLAHIFFNDPDVTEDNFSEERGGFAGRFAIFGHQTCSGDEGHCDVHDHNRRFDDRPSHPLTRAFKRVVVTDAVKRCIAAGPQLTVTVVLTTDPKASAEFQGPLLDFQGLQLTTFS